MKRNFNERVDALLGGACQTFAILLLQCSRKEAMSMEDIFKGRPLPVETPSSFSESDGSLLSALPISSDLDSALRENLPLKKRRLLQRRPPAPKPMSASKVGSWRGTRRGSC